MKNLLLVIAALSIPAMAGTVELPLFEQIDADKDGLVSKAEAGASAQLAALFDTLDTDADGQLSLAEYKAPASK
jgi:hypothetical protein